MPENSKRLKVVHIGHAPLPEGHPDFSRMVVYPGRWALNLAIAQREFAGLDVEFVTQVPGASRDHVEDIDGVRVHYLAAPDRLRAATLFAFDIRRISRRVRALGPDIVHAHGTEEAYALAAQACKVPSVITAQGCYFIINRELPPPSISRARVIQLTEWLALRRARHVIAKSSYVRDELRKAFPHLMLHEIPNTVDPRLLEIPCDRPKRFGHIAFVGTVVERKGVHLIRQALEILARRPGACLETPSSGSGTLGQLHLHIFGNRPDAPGESYEARELEALRNLLGDRLILHGVRPSLEVAEELSTIPLLVAPSLEEMFGNQLIEALLVGADAVVTDQTAMAENLCRFCCGNVVPQRDSSRLAGALAEKINVNRSDAVRREIRACVLQWVGPRPIADAHAALYHNLTGKN